MSLRFLFTSFQTASKLFRVPTIVVSKQKFPLDHRLFHNKTNSTIFEIINGVGGSEAMLFADDMFGLYIKYFQHMGWPYQVEERFNDNLGGIKSAKLIVNAQNSFEGLIQEAGVHRVQRVPRTEKHGRMHTSTVTVSVIPKSVFDIKIDERDLEIQTKRASGAGGQHVNKTESAIRIIHKPTGVAVESQEQRHQDQNRKTAMKKLLLKLQEIELEKIASQSSKMKKAQVGQANRNEKIRTYNYPQDRITDHRIGKSYYNLRGLFDGDVSVLEKIIKDFHQ